MSEVQHTWNWNESQPNSLRRAAPAGSAGSGGIAWAVTFTNPGANRLVGAPLGIIFVVPYRRIRKPHREGAIIDQPDSFGGPIHDSQWISLAPIALGVVGWKKSHTRQVVHAV